MPRSWDPTEPMLKATSRLRRAPTRAVELRREQPLHSGGLHLLNVHSQSRGITVHNTQFTMSGQDRPMGDREGTHHWTPEKVERVSNEEVKNPEGDDKDPDADVDDQRDSPHERAGVS